MKRTKFIVLVLAFLFISFSAYGQVRTFSTFLAPSVNVLSDASRTQHNGNIGVGMRSIVSPQNRGFFWGGDFIFGITYLRGFTGGSDWESVYPVSNGLFYFSLQFPFGYNWTDKVGQSLIFFVDVGPSIKARFEGAMIELGAFAEAGFKTRLNKKTGFFLSARFSSYSMLVDPAPLSSTGLVDHELTLLVGIKWDQKNSGPCDEKKDRNMSK